jgi:hypothetical protein
MASEIRGATEEELGRKKSITNLVGPATKSLVRLFEREGYRIIPMGDNRVAAFLPSGKILIWDYSTSTLDSLEISEEVVGAAIYLGFYSATRPPQSSSPHLSS